MTSEEMEGRIAALELVGLFALQAWGKWWFASGYGARFPLLRDWLIEQIDSGALPSPDDPAAKTAMRESLISMLNAPETPPERQVRAIEDEFRRISGLDQPENQ